MPKVKNVEKKIWETEGFDIVIKCHGKDLRGDKDGVPQWPGIRATRNAMTVSDWKTKFKTTYPGFDVDVLDGDGSIISAGQTQLGTLRDTYIDEDENVK